MHRFLFRVALMVAWCGMASVVAQSADPPTRRYDIILRGGIVVDGTGRPARRADIGIVGDTIMSIGDLQGASASHTVDASGLVVAPGFINMLSWATDSLIADGRGQSDLMQGVTLEIFGEGWSYGPYHEAIKKRLLEEQGDIKYPIPWNTLAGYLEHLVKRGVSPNVASFVGATTVRVYVLGYDDRRPTKQELDQMCGLVRQAMEDGALGLASALIYAPGFYAKTDELIALARAAAEYDGIYISHLRSEGNQLLEGVDEFLRIAREADITAEIYHLKAAGEANWGKLDQVIARIESARREGLGIGADIYTYTAGATGLDAAMPPWVQEGGFEAWKKRLQDADVRQRVIREMRTPTDAWENLLLMAGSPERVILVGFKNPQLKPLTGKTLAEVARRRGKSPEETAIELVVEDDSRVECVYFLMSEGNVRKKVRLPWVSLCSDAGAPAPEGVFLKSNPHPRAYGSFARLLGKYVREERVIPLELAIHKMTGLPAGRLGLRRRGLLQEGYYADVVLFDPQQIGDQATYEQPHQFAVGVRHVLVNGQFVVRDGKHTGAKPGRVVRGPGYFRSAKRRKPVKLTDAARKIHQRAYVFDGHNDLPWTLRMKASSSFDKLDIAKRQTGMHTDIPRLREGGVGAQFWSVFVPADTMHSGTALTQTIEQIELVKAMCRRYPDVFELALTADDVTRIRQEGKIASLIGMEGGHSIENSIANLRRLYGMGARYMTLTHSMTLDWADSATDEQKHGGLTPFGEQVVREMNRLGMIVDLSHVSVDTMKDALRVTRAPVMFSHSSARSIADHVRNVPDDVLRLTARNGGVVMVNFFSGFVQPESARRMKSMFHDLRKVKEANPDKEAYQRAVARWQAENPLIRGTIHDLVDHIDHIVHIAGIDHVGIGSDFDGVSMVPEQLDDVAAYPLITQELLNRGYTAHEIEKIMHGNILRVLRRVEQVARSLAK